VNLSVVIIVWRLLLAPVAVGPVLMDKVSDVSLFDALVLTDFGLFTFLSVILLL
jgi:hypothetical protein